MNELRKTLTLKPKIPAVVCRVTLPSRVAPKPIVPIKKVPVNKTAKANNRAARVKAKVQELFEKLVVDHPTLFPMGEVSPFVVGIHKEIKKKYRCSSSVAYKAVLFWISKREVAYLKAVEDGKDHQRFPAN